MTKKYILAALALCLAAADVSAQYQLDELLVSGMPHFKSDYFQRLVRPYRDRTERFSSARLDALQMSIAMGDPADELTMEGWGDNRADLRKGASRVKAEYSKLSGDGYTGSANDEDYPGDRVGAYGRFGSFEAELSRFGQDVKTLASGASETYNETGAGAGFSFGTDGVRLGFHGNFNKNEDTASDITINRNAVGGALALRTGLFELGATLDFVDRSLSFSGTDIKRAGPMLGGQAIFKPFGGFKAGARVSIAKLSGDYTVSGNKVDMEGINSEFGGRIEWAMQAVPLTLAAGLDRLYMDPEYKLGGISSKGETGNTTKTLAAAFRPFGGRLLLGAEIKDLKVEYEGANNMAFGDGFGFEANTVTGGAEVWVLPGFGLRASLQRREIKIGGSETFYNVIGGGAGLKGEKYSLDASVRRQEEDPDDGSNGDRLMEVRLMYGYRF